MGTLTDRLDTIPVRGMENGEAYNGGYDPCGEWDKLPISQLTWPRKVDLRMKPSETANVEHHLVLTNP